MVYDPPKRDEEAEGKDGGGGRGVHKEEGLNHHSLLSIWAILTVSCA